MWYAVHDASGVLLSITTVPPEDLSSDLGFAELGKTKPDWSTSEWDEGKLVMTAKPEPEPEKDKVEDLLAAVPALSKLDAVEIEALKTEVGKILGDTRYYQDAAGAEAVVEVTTK